MKIEIKLTKIPLLVPQPDTYRPSYASDEPRMEVECKGLAVLVLDVGDTDRDHHHLMDQADAFLRKALGTAVPKWEERVIELRKKADDFEGHNKELMEGNEELDRRLEISNRKREQLRRHLQVLRQQLGQFDFGSKADNDQMRRLVKLDPEAD